MGGYFFLASTYTHHPGGFDSGYADAVEALADLTGRGHIVFSPIVHFHPVAVRMKRGPDDWCFWMTRVRPFLLRASGLIVLQNAGWQKSAGIQDEAARAVERNYPCYRMEWTDEIRKRAEHHT